MSRFYNEIRNELMKFFFNPSKKIQRNYNNYLKKNFNFYHPFIAKNGLKTI